MQHVADIVQPGRFSPATVYAAPAHEPAPAPATAVHEEPDAPVPEPPPAH